MRPVTRASRACSAVLAMVAASGVRGQVAPDAAISCGACDQWNQPQEPFRVFGNTYYVGTAELSAILVATTDGLILLDAALPQSAPRIDESIRALGFDTTYIRLMLTSHTHFDHVGGVAALQRASGAVLAASPKSAVALQRGNPTEDDPQFAIAGNGFAPAGNLRVVADGESLTVGDVRITAHFTAGHTPGSTSWSWQACESDRCVDVVYADSLNPVSADEFRFTGDATNPSIVDSFRASIQTVRELPCDILLTPHPGFFGMSARLERLRDGDSEAFVDPSACRSYAAAADESLSRRIQDEQAAPGGAD